MPRLVMYAYCGMSIPMDEGDMKTVRAAAARRLRRARRRQPVTVLEKGREWELETPDDAFMVSDTDGILRIVDAPKPMVECWNCGCEVEVGESCDCMEYEPEEEDEEEEEEDEDE
jgi:hypothetical protein